MEEIMDDYMGMLPNVRNGSFSQIICSKVSNPKKFL
jgi:hypothetical protein